MKPIWLSKVSLEKLQFDSKGTMAENLGIVFTNLSDEGVEGTMPVDHRTRQPYGLLHGGASVALAETLGSVGGNLLHRLREVSLRGN